jgi:hypothetical protein
MNRLTTNQARVLRVVGGNGDESPYYEPGTAMNRLTTNLPVL